MPAKRTTDDSAHVQTNQALWPADDNAHRAADGATQRCAVKRAHGATDRTTDRTTDQQPDDPAVRAAHGAAHNGTNGQAHDATDRATHDATHGAADRAAHGKADRKPIAISEISADFPTDAAAFEPAERTTHS